MIKSEKIKYVSRQSKRKKSSGRISILRLLLTIRETTGAYNQLSLGLAEDQDITICCYFKPAVEFPPNIALFHGSGSLKGFFRALKTAIQQKTYDIVHAHTPHVGFLFLVAKLLFFINLKISRVYTVHSSYQNYKFRNKLLLLTIFAFYQKVVCCSKASLNSFPQLYKTAAGSRLTVIPNGTDIDRIDRTICKKTSYQGKNSFTIISVGRLIESKNPFVVLEAFRKAADKTERMIFMGDGYLSELVRNKVKEVSLEEQIILTGLLPREKVYEHLINADLFISASTIEGLPIAVLEAMACRCPVVLSDIPSHREIVEGADFIPLLNPADSGAFAREILRHKMMSKADRAELGNKCRNLVESRFTLKIMQKRYAEVYKQFLREQP